MWKFFVKHMTPCIVVFSIITVLVFTILSIVLSINGVVLSDTLTEWVFKFFGLEMLALSGIKVSKHIGSAFGKLEEAVDGVVSDDEPMG
jgi:hypothetical protein